MNQIQNLNINPDYLNLAKIKLVKQAITEVNNQRSVMSQKIADAEQKLKNLYQLKKDLIKVERNFRIAIFVLIIDVILIPITFASTPIIALALTSSAIALGVNILKEKQMIKHLTTLCSQSNETRLRLEYDLPEWKQKLQNVNDAQKKLQEEKEKLKQEQIQLQPHSNETNEANILMQSNKILESDTEQNYPLTEKETEQFHAYQKKILQYKE